MQGGVADVEQGFGVSNFVVDGALEISVVSDLLPGATVNGHSEEHTNVVWFFGQIGANNPFGELAVDVLRLPVLRGIFADFSRDFFSLPGVYNRCLEPVGTPTLDVYDILLPQTETDKPITLIHFLSVKSGLNPATNNRRTRRTATILGRDTHDHHNCNPLSAGYAQITLSSTPRN